MSEQCDCTTNHECPEAKRLWDAYVARITFARQTDRLRDHEAADDARQAWVGHRAAVAGKEAVSVG